MENNYTQEEKEIVEKLKGKEGSFMLSRKSFDSILTSTRDSVTKNKEARYTSRVGIVQSVVDYFHTAHLARAVMVPLAIILVVVGGATWKARSDAQSVEGITHSMSQDIAHESSEEQKMVDNMKDVESLSIVDYSMFEN